MGWFAHGRIVALATGKVSPAILPLIAYLSTKAIQDRKPFRNKTILSLLANWLRRMHDIYLRPRLGYGRG
jgi:hypothetical protein